MFIEPREEMEQAPLGAHGEELNIALLKKLSDLEGIGFYKHSAPNGAAKWPTAYITLFLSSASNSFASSAVISSTFAALNSSTIF